MSEGKLNTDAEGELLLKLLANSLLQIEHDEIMHGMTRAELEEKCFVGDKNIDIERTARRETTEKEKLVFEPDIEYERLGEHERFEDLSIERLIFVKDVVAGQLIATREAGETVPFQAGHNVEKGEMEGRECYRSKDKGKVVIIGDTMHVFRSDIDCSIAISVSADKMRAFMNCTAEYGNGKELTYERIIENMERAGVLWGIQEENIRKAIQSARSNHTVQSEVLVAEGRPPQRGNDATVEYGFEISSDKHTMKVLPDGRIDYHGSANIPTTAAGRFLAKIGDAAPGVDGMNVRGEILPAEAGRAETLVAGQGVRRSDNGKEFYSEIDGCIMLNPPLLEVMELYEVNGDVDYNTGSIDFKGNVVVNGIVREGFEVKASGDIIVQKGVEAARLTAGRDVQVYGGIQGKGKGLVSAGRDVYAEFAQNARIEAQGNVYIGDFAVNSYIFCNRLKAAEQHGAVVGGEVFARRGVDVLNIGSPSGTKTSVSVGTDYLVRRKINEVDEAIEFCASNISKIDAALRPVIEVMKSNRRAAGERKAILEKTLEKRKALEIQKHIMEAKRSRLYEQLEVQAVCFVKVKQVCHGDVYLTIRQRKMRVGNKRENVQFYEDIDAGEIKTGAY